MKLTINLEEHNIKTYEVIQKSLKEKNHIGVVQATGTGKSYIIAKTIVDDDFKKVLFLAPSLYIINQFKENFSDIADKITFMTYKKLSYIKDLEGFLMRNNFDIVILDEYHRCGAKTWGAATKNLLSIYSDKKVLGVTATPVRFLDNCRDMTKELFDSEPVVELSLLKAIEQNIIKKPKYIISYYNVEGSIYELNKKIKSTNNKDISNNIAYIVNNIKNLINIEDVLKNNITTERKFIVFCSNIEHLRYVKSIMPIWFNSIGFEVKTYSLYADIENPSNNKKMKLELDEFKNATSNDNVVHLMFSVNMLNEGLHINGVDGLFFLRKTISPIIMTQQLGRALNVGKENPPIIFDLVDNISELSFLGYFYNENALNSNVENKKDKKDYTLSNAIEVKDYTVDLNSLLKEIEELAELSSWDAFKTKLIDFKNENGHCNVPSGHKLYKRCLGLKKQHEKGVLENYKYEELNMLGFNWEISIYNDKLWESMFEKLVNFVQENGHANVPRNYKIQELATWVHTQRKNEHKMSTERKNKLLSVGFQFKLAKKLNDERWEEMFNELLKFKEKYGHTKVSSRYEDKTLSNWVNSQKKSFKAKKLLPERCERLVSIGFEFPCL